MPHWDSVIALAPGHVDAHLRRGRALQSLGRLDEGIVSIEKALALAPESPSCYLELANAKRLQESDPHFIDMLKLASKLDSLSEPDRINLHFALAKALGDIGNYQESGRHLLRGN